MKTKTTSALLEHLVREDPDLELRVFKAQMRKGVGGLNQLPPSLLLKGFLFVFETPIHVHVGAHAEDHVAARSGGPDQLLKGFRRGMSCGKDPRRYNGREVIGGQVQLPAQLPLAELLIHALRAGELKHVL